MGKAAADSANGAKMVPADAVSVLLMAIGNTSISRAQFDMMSALDGTRTWSSFEHQFRSITAKAKELKERVDNGETFTPVASKKRGAPSVDDMTPPATPKKPKAIPKPRARKAATKGKAKGSGSSDNSNSPTNDLGGIASGVKQEEDLFDADI